MSREIQQELRFFHTSKNKTYHIICQLISQDYIPSNDFDHHFFLLIFGVNYFVTCKLFSQPLVANILNQVIYGRKIDVENAKFIQYSLTISQKKNLEIDLKEIISSRISENQLPDEETGENLDQTYDGDSECSEDDDSFEDDSSSYNTEDEIRFNSDGTTNQNLDGNDECSPIEDPIPEHEMRSSSDGNIEDTNQTYDGIDEDNILFIPYDAYDVVLLDFQSTLYDGNEFYENDDIMQAVDVVHPQHDINGPQYFN
ncbi:14800_t:CDS:1 [Funneliformis geosporum]|uniref:6170_t:CDS:1 n=1 Tax=Funneliformis geosporum TaxID=1117311 RepID=A0A9W4X0M6_9GLOM|nr:14800_t:CDS:1 [Funneliformis geosporum]CAI2177663.1 6170_t:CDS:1 [Funneliformis geosporum]